MTASPVWRRFRVVAGLFLVGSAPYIYRVEGNRLFGVLALLVGLVWFGYELRQYLNRSTAD